MVTSLNQNNANLTPPKKRSFWRSLLVVVLVFVFVSVLVGRAVLLTLENYNLNLAQVQEYVTYLNQPVNMETLVTDPITQSDYDSFVTKAQNSGFGVFDETENVDLEQETIALTSDITLTDNEMGAFLNRTISGTDEEYSDLFVLLQLNMVPSDAAYTLTTVASINFASVKDQIDVLIDDFPTIIYITTTSEVLVANNQLQITQTTVQLNQVEQEVNNEMVSFLNTLFGTTDGEYTFSELVSVLVQEQLDVVTTKTSSYIVLQDGAITLTLTEPVLVLDEE